MDGQGARTLSDVVRAVSEGKVPYMDWERRAVEDMRERMSRGLKGMSPKVSAGMARSHVYDYAFCVARKCRERHS